MVISKYFNTLILSFAFIFFISCGEEKNKKDNEQPAEAKKEAPAAGTEEKTILFFGNSLTAGYGLNDISESFPSLIQDIIDSLRLPYKTINGGVSGETSAGGNSRIDWLLKQKVDTTRLLKMIILHDLVEAEARDISALDVLRNPEIKVKKIEQEKIAIENLRSVSNETNGQEIYDLFYEFEDKKTYEAKVANALDKLEVQLQHNHANFSSWEEIEYDMCYMMDKHALFDPTIFELKTQIENQATEKMQSNGVDTVLVKQRVSGATKKDYL